MIAGSVATVVSISPSHRGSAVTRFAEAGCEVPETAITGHSLADVEAILDAHYLGRTTKLAVSGMAKLERAAGGSQNVS